MRAIRFLLEAAAFAVIVGIARVVPRRALAAVGSGAGRLAYAIDRTHRRIALENLRTILGASLPEGEVRRIAKACWRHFGRILFEALAFPRLSAESVGAAVRYEGLEHIRAAYARGRGVILFSAHYGHWELVALMQGYLGMPLALVARPLDNRFLERTLAKLRSGSGNVIIHKRNAVREMLRAIRCGIGVAIVIDQDARDLGVFVPFLGRPASTTPTLALLALRTGAAVVPVFSVPLDGGAWKVVYEPEVEVPDSGDHEADVLRLTADATAVVEKWVRLHPELWLWMHRRWKTTPRERTP
ncbi:MAG: lysophospholipid acyltransferase family protein [Acidobacteriia bacterium]|nr:lysophospholipid acyltransferase family protein [Terriglobia bacterium]